MKRNKTIKDVVQTAKNLVAKRDEEIVLLKKQLIDVQGEKHVTFKMPNIMEVINFPAIQRVHIENAKDIQKVEVVGLENLSKDLQKVEVVNMPEIEIKDSSAKWVPTLIVHGVKSIIQGIAEILNKKITVKLDDEEKLKPQAVFLVDIRTGKPAGVPSPATYVVPIGNNSGGSPIIAESLDQYHVSDLDDTSTPKYYGFLTKDGAWYIMKNDTVANNYRYVKGSSSYTTAWSNRASLSYDYFDIIF